MSYFDTLEEQVEEQYFPHSRHSIGPFSSSSTHNTIDMIESLYNKHLTPHHDDLYQRFYAAIVHAASNEFSPDLLDSIFESISRNSVAPLRKNVADYMEAVRLLLDQEQQEQQKKSTDSNYQEVYSGKYSSPQKPAKRQSLRDLGLEQQHQTEEMAPIQKELSEEAFTFFERQFMCTSPKIRRFSFSIGQQPVIPEAKPYPEQKLKLHSEIVQIRVVPTLKPNPQLSLNNQIAEAVVNCQIQKLKKYEQQKYTQTTSHQHRQLYITNDVVDQIVYPQNQLFSKQHLSYSSTHAIDEDAMSSRLTAINHTANNERMLQSTRIQKCSYSYEPESPPPNRMTVSGRLSLSLQGRHNQSFDSEHSHRSIKQSILVMENNIREIVRKENKVEEQIEQNFRYFQQHRMQDDISMTLQDLIEKYVHPAPQSPLQSPKNGAYKPTIAVEVEQVDNKGPVETADTWNTQNNYKQDYDKKMKSLILKKNVQRYQRPKNTAAVLGN